MNTTAQDVFDSFESTFQDKKIIPIDLEVEWLKKAVGVYCAEIENINFDSITLNFDKILNKYTIDTLGVLMRIFYQEREISKINKRVSIVSKEISIDGTNGSKISSQRELEHYINVYNKMISNQKPTAYS